MNLLIDDITVLNQCYAVHAVPYIKSKLYSFRHTIISAEAMPHIRFENNNNKNMYITFMVYLEQKSHYNHVSLQLVRNDVFPKIKQ